MDIKNEIKSGMKLASDVASDAVQALVEKSRLRANANRIKMVIKSDAELRNQAYIELGRFVYENMRDELDDDNESLCVVVDKTTKRINKATEKYVDYLNRLSETKLCGDNADKLKKAVCDKACDISEKTKVKAQDIKQAAKETVADISYIAKDKVNDIKACVMPDEDIDGLIFDEQDSFEDDTPSVQPKTPSVTTKEDTQDEINSHSDTASMINADDEESPQEFDF